MAMNPRLLRPRRFGVVGDSDVVNYIAAVEAADGQALEQGVRDAFAAFITGCKQDGIWSAIKASCILAGARTLSGALVPLVGSAPTNNNFVSGDYDRKTGLIGNASTKYLDTNRNNNADPQDDNHNSVYVSVLGSGGVAGCYLGTSTNTGGANTIGDTGTQKFSRSRSFTSTDLGTRVSGFFGNSRSASASYIVRLDSQNTTVSVSSDGLRSENLTVYRRGSGSPSFIYSNARLAFYSIGESLDLALLDARVTALVTAIGAAIP